MTITRPLNRSRHWQLIVAIFSMSVLSLYVYAMLSLSDKVLFSLVPGYQTTGHYEFGVAIFFLSSAVYLYLIRKQDWRRSFPFLSVAVSLFFPLVVLSSILRIQIGLPNELQAFYTDNLCISTDGDQLCGQALAHIVFCMTVRALPLVLTVPLLYQKLFDCLLPPSKADAAQ